MTFVAPRTIQELVNILVHKKLDTHIVAGGTDLFVQLKKQNQSCYNLIDISKIQEMQIMKQNNDNYVIGSTVTISNLEKSDVIKKVFPALYNACQGIGSTQIRNRATIGGNICNSSASADLLPVLYAYGATGQIINSQGNLRIEKIEKILDNGNGFGISDDEALMSITIPIRPHNEVSAFSKIGARESVTISKLNCCMLLLLDERKKIISSISYMGAIGIRPVRTDKIEVALHDKSIKDLDIKKFEAVIKEQIDGIIPERASREYKREAAVGVMDDIFAMLQRYAER